LRRLSQQGISGAKMEKACDEAHITLNKNAVVGDVSAMNPGGVRIGEQLKHASWNSS
jgi:glycine hydroxymethyltransferase